MSLNSSLTGLRVMDSFCRPHLIRAGSLSEALKLYFLKGQNTTVLTNHGETEMRTLADGLPLFSENHCFPWSSETHTNLIRSQLDTATIVQTAVLLVSNGVRIGKFYRPDTLFIGPSLEQQTRQVAASLPFRLTVEVIEEIDDDRWIVADLSGADFTYRQLAHDFAEFSIVHGAWIVASIAH